MASPTQWTWVWVNSGSWWWTGRPGVLRFTGSQRGGHDWATELNWTLVAWVIIQACICRAPYVSSYFSFWINFVEQNAVILSFQRRILRFREVKQSVQGHTAGQWWVWDLSWGLAAFQILKGSKSLWDLSILLPYCCLSFTAQLLPLDVWEKQRGWAACALSHSIRKQCVR